MIETLILSVVQGVTEFIPVSSSSHLFLFSDFLNFQSKSLSIDVSLHIGSFIAIITYFYKDIINFVKNKDLFIKIIISSIPVMVIGFILIQTNLIENIWTFTTIHILPPLLSLGIFAFIYNAIPQKSI